MKSKKLSEKLDLILISKNLNREYLAKKIGCTVQNLSTVIKNNDPKLSFAIKLCNALDVDFCEFFEIEKNKTIYKASEPDEAYNIKNFNEYTPPKNQL